MNPKTDLISIINYIKIEKFLDETDFSYSHYDNKKEAIADFDNIIQRINKNDNSVFEYISILFLPTGGLQEISISNDWGDEFLEIASRVDNLLAKLT